MKKFLVLITVIACCTNHSATAQIWKNAEKKIGKKIEQKASQRAERKIDKAIDKGLDKVEEAPNQKKQDDQSAADEAPASQTQPAKERRPPEVCPVLQKQTSYYRINILSTWE